MEAGRGHKTGFENFPENRVFHVGYCVSLQYTNDINNIKKAIEHIKPLRHKHEDFAHTYVQAVKSIRGLSEKHSNI